MWLGDEILTFAIHVNTVDTINEKMIGHANILATIDVSFALQSSINNVFL